jgi:hypothetical protein
MMSDDNENDNEGIVVEQPDSGTDSGSERLQRPKPENDPDELESYSKGVQARIRKLTAKYRQEELEKAEAVRISEQLFAENQQLKQRMQALDTGYVSEYGTRIETQLEAVKRQYKEAFDAGDADRMADAQQKLAQIAFEQQRYNTAKMRLEQEQRLRAQQQQQPVQRQAAPQPQVDPEPKALEWKSRNEWFGQDKVMTAAAGVIHAQLVNEEGFDPQSDEYYSEIDRRLRKEFPQRFTAARKTGGSQVASAGNSASRSTNQGRRTVKLTHSQVAIAKRLGVPLEEYAKYVKE